MDYKKLYEQTLVENEALHEQLEQNNEWFQEINSICGVDPQEPAVESVRDTIQELKGNQLTEESAIDYVYQHTSDYEDWIMGSDIYLKLQEENKKLKN